MLAEMRNRPLGFLRGAGQRVDTAYWNAKLKQSNCRASASIDEYGLFAGFDQGAWPEAIGPGGSAPPSQAMLRGRVCSLLHSNSGISHDLLPMLNL